MYKRYKEAPAEKEGRVSYNETDINRCYTINAVAICGKGLNI